MQRERGAGERRRMQVSQRIEIFLQGDPGLGGKSELFGNPGPAVILAGCLERDRLAGIIC